MIKASIIIPSFGSRVEYLHDTIVSAHNQSMPRSEYEIIVVDNSPDGRVKEIVDKFNAEEQLSVRYVREIQAGLHSARHAGAREAAGEILVYVDDDVLTPSDWLTAITGPFRHPQVGCAGGKNILKFETEPPCWYAHFNGGGLSKLDLGDKVLELKYPGIWGCNMAVRKNIFYEVGGANVDSFGDPKLIWFSGDGECGLQEKIHKAGYKIIYDPKAWLYHRIPESRLRPEYFYTRWIFAGILDSYGRVRRLHKKPFFYLRLMIYGLFGFFMAARKYVYSLIFLKKKIKLRADAFRWYATAQHQIRTVFSRRLRDHVLRESYL